MVSLFVAGLVLWPVFCATVSRLSLLVWTWFVYWCYQHYWELKNIFYYCKMHVMLCILVRNWRLTLLATCTCGIHNFMRFIFVKSKFYRLVWLACLQTNHFNCDFPVFTASVEKCRKRMAFSLPFLDMFDVQAMNPSCFTSVELHWLTICVKPWR